MRNLLRMCRDSWRPRARETKLVGREERGQVSIANPEVRRLGDLQRAQ